jgi:anti-anti-sigma regulatory factor
MRTAQRPFASVPALNRPNANTIELTGPGTPESAGVWRDQILERMAASTGAVELDLSAVAHWNLEGIQVVVAAQNLARDRDRSFRLRNCPESGFAAWRRAGLESWLRTRLAESG